MDSRESHMSWSEQHPARDVTDIDSPEPYRIADFEARNTPVGSDDLPSRQQPSPSRLGYIDDIKYEAMASYLFQQQCTTAWIGQGAGLTEGVLVRRARQDYITCPTSLLGSELAYGCLAMNVTCAMTVNSRVIKTFLALSPKVTSVPLKNGLRVQILPTISDLQHARKTHYAAIVALDGLLVVWDDDPLHLFTRGHAIENELKDMVWNGSIKNEQLLDAVNEKEFLSEKDKHESHVTAIEVDEERGEPGPEARPVHLLNAILVAFTLCLVVVMLGAGWRQLAVEVAVDHNYLRCAFILLTPLQVFFTLFFLQVVVGCTAQIIGPIKQISQNSRFYSARPPTRIVNRPLPHVTIQCPVYKEGLEAVIAPTVRSLKAAISTYEMQGGSANIFINDDGLQLLDEQERQERIDFYSDNSIGWTARPKHGMDGFVRKGRFKKASNMNFGLGISNAVEAKLGEVHRPDGWTQHDEAMEYDRCLREVLNHSRGWADGSIRIGDYILIVDSDTRIPKDCLWDAVSEMEQSPEVGIIQFASGVMQVVNDYFENGITFFTNLIYTSIKYTVSNGDVAPFVGHNAILRWSAIQQIGYFDGDDDYEKFWSEAHVSEDFEMSLKLQCNGYTIRLASWDHGGFKEGVSLTVYDELARWEKYAYGCNELLFNPIRTWLWRGPFTPLFRRFLTSNIRFTSKVTIISYIGTYYAIGAAWLLTMTNYFAVGWFHGYLDQYYIDSWKVWFSIVIVFSGLGNFALAAIRYRIGERTFFGSLLENFKWSLMFAIFLGGLSLHVSQALLAHLFEINMTWGATAKEAEVSNFFLEVPKVLRRFKGSMGVSVVGIIGMVILAIGPFIPWDWRITDFIAILPMATVCVSHLLLPVALNPALMNFTF